jgi:hypothetical protein
MTKQEWAALDPEDRECECCQYPTECEEYSDPVAGPSMLCEICASTYLSKPFLFPRHYDEDTKLLSQSIGWIANKIIEEIRKARPYSGPRV